MCGYSQFKKTLFGALLLAFSTVSQAQELTTIDVLLLYTSGAEATRAGRDIEARAAAIVEYANQAYSRSDVPTRLRLVGVNRFDEGYDAVNEGNLDALRSNARVAAMRRETGADLVSLLTLPTAQGGGYICGIGYLSSGNANSGQFYSYASSIGYSLVGVNCGLSTLAHELGHNMGLGHSYRQGSQGGVHSWARGHGVDGWFSTIMAYPQSYGTSNQLPYFSNPRIVGCEGVACGVDRSRADGADAAESLNIVIGQVGDFSPTVITDGDGGGSPTPTPTPTPTPQPTVTPTAQPTPTPTATPTPTPTPIDELPTCAKPDVAGNLIVNGEFDRLDGWSSAFNASYLEQEFVATHCRDAVLQVTNRSQYYSAAFQSLTGKIQAGSSYDVAARLSIRGTGRADVRIAFQLVTGGRVSYQYLDAVSVTSSEFTEARETIRFDTADVTGMVIYGPPAGVDLVIDSVSMVARVTEPPATGAIVNDSFELTASGWGTYYGGRLSYSSTASEGEYSLLSSNRRSAYSGPMRDLTGLLSANIAYQLQLDVQVTGRQSQPFHAWLYYEDASGGHWLNLLRESIQPGYWQTLSTGFSVPTTGELRSATLVFFGPGYSSNFWIDQVTLTD